MNRVVLSYFSFLRAIKESCLRMESRLMAAESTTLAALTPVVELWVLKLSQEINCKMESNKDNVNITERYGLRFFIIDEWWKKCEIRSTKYKVQSTKSKVRSPKSEVLINVWC